MALYPTALPTIEIEPQFFKRIFEENSIEGFIRVN